VALTFNNFWGAESGDLTETQASSNASVSSVEKRTGGYAYTFSNANGWVLFKAFKGNIADAGNAYFIEFSAFIPDVTPAASSVMMQVFDSAASASQCALVLNTSGQLVLFDSTGAPTTLAASPGLVINTWTKFMFYFENLASGDCEIFVDGISKGSLTGKNLKNGATIIDIIGVYACGSASGCYQDDIACYSGAADSGDLPEPGECHAYWSTLNNATGDVGGALASGTWDLIQHTPFETSVQAQYDTTGAGSVDTDDSGGSEGTGGPNTDTNITGTIAAIKGLWRFERGTGGASAHYGLLGNNVDGTTRSIDFNPLQTPVNHEMVSVAASIVPTSSEYCRIGIETTGAQNFECYGMLATIWHIPSAGSTTFESWNAVLEADIISINEVLIANISDINDLPI